MNQDLFHLKPLKEVLEQIIPLYIIPTKIGIRHIRMELLFHTHVVCVSSRDLQNCDRIIPYILFKCVSKCVFAYMVATPMSMILDPTYNVGCINTSYLRIIISPYEEKEDMNEHTILVLIT